MGSRYKSDHPFGFGRKLFEIRSDKGMTQAELADKLGVSVRTISYYERRSKNPTLHILEKIAEALGTSMQSFLEGKETAMPGVQDSPRVIKALRQRLPQLGALSIRDQESLVAVIDGLLSKK